MTDYVSIQSTPQGPIGYLRRAESWLDDRGRGAWIVAMVLGFIFVWPVGLALLAYMIWSNKMFSKSRSSKSYSGCGRARHGAFAMKSSGNTAFDAYKQDTLRRLEEEQDQFEAFLDRLRTAKDKAEFDQFMDERQKTAKTDDSDTREEIA